MNTHDFYVASNCLKSLLNRCSRNLYNAHLDGKTPEYSNNVGIDVIRNLIKFKNYAKIPKTDTVIKRSIEPVNYIYKLDKKS